MVDECPELIYAQYNYHPPIHFAVREGHLDLVRYLLRNGAHAPDYRSYPFFRAHRRCAGLCGRALWRERASAYSALQSKDSIAQYKDCAAFSVLKTA